jgi:hypothetical protein
MPEINRRRLLLGFAAASTAAAGVSLPATAAAPIENPRLIELGDKLETLESACLSARDKVHAIEAYWTPRWPKTPAALLDEGNEVDRDFQGYVIYEPDRPRIQQTYASPDDIDWRVDNARRIVRGRTIDKRKIRGAGRAEWEQELARLSRLRPIAKRHEARRARVMKQSGYKEAKKAREIAMRNLGDLVSEAVALPATGMAGVMIKAQALAAWGRHADALWNMSYPGALTWGSDLARSVLTVAELQS